MYSKNKPSVQGILKKEKEICTDFVIPPQIAKVSAIVCDKYLAVT